MSEQFTSRKKRSRSNLASASPSTAECFEKGPPKTSGRGHHAGGKQKNAGHFHDVPFNIRFKNCFSDAPDCLANPELNERLQKMKEQLKLQESGKHPKDKKRKKGKQQEEPLDIAMREQSFGWNRREQSPVWHDRNDKEKFQEMDDEEVQEMSKPKHRSRQSDLQKKSTEPVWSILDDMPIPRKKVVKQFGLKKKAQLKEANAKRTDDVKKADSYCSIDSSPNDKCNAIRGTSQLDTIDLCAEGETDSEDNNADQSKYRHESKPRTTRKTAEINQPAETLSREEKTEATKIIQMVDDIRSDEIFVPQKPFNLSKAPLSSEGRKITTTFASSDRVDGTKRKSPLDRAVGLLTLSRTFKQKKSANTGHPILPGASLESKRSQTRSNWSLESDGKRNRKGAPSEANISLTTPNRTLVCVESSDDDFGSQLKWLSTEKSAAKRKHKNDDEDFSFDDVSSANSVTKKRKNKSKRKPAISSPIRRTRSSTRKSPTKRNQNEVVDMLDDSDDEENTLACFDIARIAIGSAVKQQNCQIKIIDDGILACSYAVRSKEKVHNIDFKNGEVAEVHYYIDNTIDITGRLPSDDAAIEPGSFIALKAQKTKQNGFSSASSYVPGDSTDEKGLIVAEFRSDADMATFMRVVQENNYLSAFFPNENQLSRDRADLYAKALVADAKKEALNRNKKVRSSNRVGFLAGKSSTDLLLRFPFGGDPSAIDAAANGLAEFQFLNCTDINEEERNTEMYESSELCAPDGNDDNRRRHYVEISVEDFERLDPGVYLNDTLIDFFLQWMTRKHTLPDLHVFTTHFYTALEDKGPEGVSNWTTKKKIDVFKLRFIYIPINKALHWSFCVVVNPGYILERQKGRKSGGDEPMPCLLFFDSLKMHQKDRVHRNVIKWLNAEWVRLSKSSSREAPFDRSSFPVLTPKVQYQDNSWDCGVFVCRYASGIFQLRDRVFSHNELMVDRNVIEMITEGDEFKFDLKNIAKIREEMKMLIERLSAIFLPWRKKMDQEEVLKKLAESKAKSKPNSNQQESESVSETNWPNKPKRFAEEDTDMLPCSQEKGTVHDSRGSTDSPASLATQNDFGAFEKLSVKENIDFEAHESPSYEAMGFSKDYGMSYVDSSPSHRSHDVDERCTSNFNQEGLDAASI